MKRNYKNKILGMSLVTAMLLGSSAYAGKIKTDTDLGWEVNKQYGFTGWNLDNVDVKIVSVEDFTTVTGTFNSDGTYTTMEIGDSFESDIKNSSGVVMAHLRGKDWPVGEPAGIKIINGDTNTKNGKPENCIINTSYLSEDKNGGVDGLLNTEVGEPAPVICSSPFQSHKRFKVKMMETMVADYNDTTRYGKPVDLVFNLDPTSTGNTRYQVFQKINNYTGMRLDGYKIEVLDENGTVKAGDLNLSIGLLENPKQTGAVDIWNPEDLANFSHGLWGPETFEEPVPHFPTDGFFDKTRAGFVVDPNGHETSTLVAGPTTLDDVAPNNYDNLFGLWLPSKWAPIGIFHDHDNDPLTDAELVAFWGTVPDAPQGTLPAWHKGKDYDNPANSWAEPTIEELLTWITDPLYDTDLIEDTLNLGLNYIVNVGENANIGDTFTIRITPRVAADQTPPNYIMDDNTTYIMPTTDYNGTDPVIIISPAPYFDLDADLSVGVADPALNTDPDVNETKVIVITTTSGDEENLTLTETDTNSSIFVGTIGSDTSEVFVQDGTVNVVNGTVVTATYGALTATTTATDGTVTPPPAPPADVINPSSGGGGCTYNPNSKHFDMMFLVMMALGLLYPFRRRFIK